MNKNKKLVNLWLKGFALIVIAASILIVWQLFTPPSQGFNEPQVVEVNKGEGLNQIIGKLDQHELLRSAFLFKLTTLAMGKGKSFKRGVYQFERPISMWEMMRILDEGRERLIEVTIPEGYRMTEIFKLLKSKGFKNEGKYAKFANDPAFIKRLKLPVEVPHLEGFLFPETYLFSEDANERVILAKMTETFIEKLPRGYSQKATSVGLNFYQAMILASIVEKETGKSSERPTISAVFHNRLRKGMKLQTDPTVIYGIKNYKGNIRTKHLRAYTPYNTYVIKGLPPTPIANAGHAALIAAVEPEQSPYIFFVAKGDGSHYFSKTFKEHNKAVTQYQKRRVKNYRSH